MPPLKVDSPHSLKNFAGKEIAVTDWLLISQERINQFAEATEDRQWIHVDRERAQKESPYGTTIAHGFLMLSLLSLFIKQSIQFSGGITRAINYGLNRVRFPSPVRSGSQIRARIGLLSVKERADALEAVFSISLEVQGSQRPCCVAEWIVLYYPN